MISLEFAGLPGSGKSYWTEYAAAQLRAKGREAWLPRESLRYPLPVRSADKLWSSIRAISRSPAASAEAVRVVWASQRSQIQGVRRSLQWLDTQGRLAKRGPAGGTVIMDEGPLQALWSIGLDGEWTRAFEALQRSGYRRCDRAVVLHLPPEAALLRLESRIEGHRRLDALGSHEEKLALLQRGADLLQTLVAVWTDLHGDHAVQQLDAERPELVAQQIRDLFSGPLRA